MSTIIRSNASRFAIASVLTLATATGAFAASRGHNTQAAREAAALRNQATYGAYASAPVYGSSGYAQAPAAEPQSEYLDQAKGHID
jgi:hypothetical protein